MVGEHSAILMAACGLSCLARGRARIMQCSASRHPGWLWVHLLVLLSACTPVRPDHLAQPDKGRLGRGRDGILSEHRQGTGESAVPDQIFRGTGASARCADALRRRHRAETLDPAFSGGAGQARRYARLPRIFAECCLLPDDRNARGRRADLSWAVAGAGAVLVAGRFTAQRKAKSGLRRAQEIFLQPGVVGGGS